MRLGLVLVVVLVLAGAAHAADPVLTGNVGANDSFTISLADPSGAPIRHVDAGTYTLVVHDQSAFHNFHLSGPGVETMTPVEGKGDFTFTVTLTDGTYAFRCDPHAPQMKGAFTVGSVAAAPPPKTTKLTGSIGATGAAMLRPAGGLSAGPYAITVTDKSVKDGFRLSGPGVTRSTGKAFKGTVTWAVTLAAGRYTFGSAAKPKLRRAFTVAG